tara:strand:+ start:1066 stop:1308 length:243 start_codon:yes stop_codon:yes gene_type:complete
MALQDINSRKLELISRLLELEDEAIFARIDELLKDAGVAAYSAVSEAAVRYRISRSEQDIRNGDTLTQEEAELESEKWGK